MSAQPDLQIAAQQVRRQLDHDPSCLAWAAVGECIRNPGFMNFTCGASCATAPVNNNSGCVEWASAGECERNPAYMKRQCIAACIQVRECPEVVRAWCTEHEVTDQSPCRACRSPDRAATPMQPFHPVERSATPVVPQPVVAQPNVSNASGEDLPVPAKTTPGLQPSHLVQPALQPAVLPAVQAPSAEQPAQEPGLTKE